MLKYELEQIKFSELKNKIRIPKFQRGLVWGDTKKREFIKSLKAGLPIGVLLLSKDKDGKWLVVDGLQRFTTMLEYSKDYFSYIDPSEITESDVVSVIISSPYAKEIYDLRPEQDQIVTREKIRKIIVESISTGQNKNLQQISKTAAQKLCKEVAEFDDKTILDILDAVYIIVEKFSKSAQIDDIEIPLIIFNGSDDELATVFQKLNQEGVKLSKYDVFAATWSNHTVNIKGDPDFIKQIIKKYESSQDDSGLEIYNFDPDEMLKTGNLTVFEYAFALGKELKEKCPVLFNTKKDNKKDDSKVESIGFLILAELLGLSYNRMTEMASELVRYNKKLDYCQLKNAIVDTAKSIQTVLGDYIIAPTKNKPSLACHSELQLTSFIVVLFKLRYDISIEHGLTDKGGKSKETKEVKRFLHKHYLYDILRGYWSGSGDTKLEEIIADPTTCRYVKDVNRESFEQVISEWLTTANKKSVLSTTSIETKLFLNYLLRLYVSSSDIAKKDYDIEHCVPKKVLQDYFIKKNTPVPISPACNLVYIPKAENRGKGDLTYYQKQKKDAGSYTLNTEALATLSYPRKKDLAFVESVETITTEKYFTFLSDREKYITKRMIDGLYE